MLSTGPKESVSEDATLAAKRSLSDIFEYEKFNFQTCPYDF